MHKLPVPVNFDLWPGAHQRGNIPGRSFMDEAAVARQAPAIPDLTAKV
jgi:hypothetical protein